MEENPSLFTEAAHIGKSFSNILLAIHFKTLIIFLRFKQEAFFIPLCDDPSPCIPPVRRTVSVRIRPVGRCLPGSARRVHSPPHALPVGSRLAAALAANPYVLNDGQSLLMSSMGIACSASLLCGTILLCLKYRFTAYVLLPAIILFNAGLYMMQMRYGLVLNLSVLSSMAETNFQEACAFCTPASIAGTLLLAGLSTWPSTGAAVPCAKKPRGAHWHAFGACTRPFCC